MLTRLRYECSHMTYLGWFDTRRGAYLALSIVIMAGLLIRLSGLWNGLGFHPDERHMVGVVLDLSWSDLNPKSFAYGSVPYYLAFLLSKLATGSFELLGFHETARFLRGYDGIFILGRLACTVAGTIGIFLTYRLARALSLPRSLSVCAALVLAMNLLHIQLSRFFTSDVLLTTFMTASLWCMTMSLRSPKRHWVVWGGITTGLSIATKISGLTLFIPFALVTLLSLKGEARPMRKALANVAIYSALASLAFAITMPYALLDHTLFLTHLNEQLEMVRGRTRPPYTIQYVDTAPYFYHLHQMWSYTVGWVVSAAAVVGIFTITRTSTLRLWLPVLAWASLYFLSTAGAQVKFLRYLLPLYPIVGVLAASGMACVFRCTGETSTRAAPTPPHGDELNLATMGGHR